MKRLLFLGLFLIAFKSNSQQYLGPLSIFKVSIRLQNGIVINKILYEVKADELILVDDSPLIKDQLRTNTDLKFTSILLEDNINSLKIRRRKYFLNYLGKGIVGGIVLGIGVTFVIFVTTERGSEQFLNSENFAGFSTSGAILGALTSPIIASIPRKSYSESELKKGFPVEEMKIFSVKWQIENRVKDE